MQILKSSATARRYLKMLTETGYIELQGGTNNSIAGYSSPKLFICREI